MLQISEPLKGAGKGEYYLGLAKEDYYLHGGEPPGQWRGAGAQTLGLAGEVQKPQLRQLFSGYSPLDGTAAVQNAGKTDRIIGWDLVFSAPKSVSVAWSQAAPELRAAIQNAQEQAVGCALDYLETAATLSRRGRGGESVERAQPIFALFEHGTSRAQDPQLHTHAILLNVCLRADGTFGTVLAREFFRHKMAAGALYRAELASQLERLGFAIERDGDFFKIRGVNGAICDEFSKRRHQIQDYLARHGGEGAVAAKFAAVATREVKGHIARAELFRFWQEIGQAFGWSTNEVSRLIDHERHALDTRGALDAVNEQLSTRRKEFFSARDLVRFVAEQAQGRGLDGAAVLNTAAAFLEQEAVSLFPRNGELVFTTRERIDTELRNPKQARYTEPPPTAEELTKGSNTPRPDDVRKPAQWIELRYWLPFPKAWGTLRHVALPYLALPILDPNPQFGRTLWQKQTPVGTLKLREKFLFPNAPDWSPLAGRKSYVLKMYPEPDPLSLKAAISELNPFRPEPVAAIQRGDRVFFSRPVKILGVARGDAGVVREIKHDTLKVLFDNGRLVAVPDQYHSSIILEDRQRRLDRERAQDDERRRQSSQQRDNDERRHRREQEHEQTL